MIERARPVYFAGDSNTIAFQYLAVAPAPAGVVFVTQTCRIAMRSCADLLRGDALDPALLSFVRSRIVYAASAHPALVLMAGTIDFAAILRAIGPRAEAFVEDEALDGRLPPSALPLVPSLLLDELVEEYFAPLVRAIELLKCEGLERLVLHSLHPPTVDDARYFALRRVVCTARARYGTVAAINRHFERICAKTGIAFLDLWDATTVDGVLDERLSLDGDHLNYEGALLTISALLEARLV